VSEFKDTIISSCRPGTAAAAAAALAMLYSYINSVEASISCSNCRPAARRPQDQCDHIHDGSGARSTALAIQLGVARPAGTCTSHNGRNNYWRSPVVRSSRRVSPLPPLPAVRRINQPKNYKHTRRRRRILLYGAVSQNGDIFPNARRIIYPPPPLTPAFHLTASGRQRRRRRL